MSKPAPAPSSRSATTLTVALCVAWAIVTLLFFLLFSSPGADGTQPGWFFLGISFLEAGAFVGAAVLCFRNWRSPQIVSGRDVWFWIGLGLSSYALGNVMFFLWGNVWNLDPAVSMGDFFYIASYVFLATGMLKAVLPRRLNLDPPQWLIVIGLGLGGILVAYLVNYRVIEAVPTAQAAPLVQLVQAPVSTPGVAPAPAVAPPVEAPSNAPGWVLSLDQQLEPFESTVSLLYVIADCVLLVLAAMLLVAFWGGRFSQSWKLIAIAALCLYIADMFFAYSVNLGTYQEGSLWEVFWTFSAVFFGLGAAVEYAISTQSRRSSRRRRA